jgi:hypothetical protein
MERHQIRNTNFISGIMTKRDIQSAFTYKGNVVDFIYKVLIEEGYLQRHSDRWYKPTEKLLDLALVPPIYEMNEMQRRFLQAHTSFTKEDLTSSFDGNQQIIKALMRRGSIKLDADRRYRLGDAFAELLADGETTITFEKEE